MDLFKIRELKKGNKTFSLVIPNNICLVKTNALVCFLHHRYKRIIQGFVVMVAVLVCCQLTHLFFCRRRSTVNPSAIQYNPFYLYGTV